MSTGTKKVVVRLDGVAAELALLYRQHRALDPAVVVAWAKKHPTSALHARFTWDDSKAAREHRLWQARQIITEVEVTYADGRVRQVYVSPVPMRRRGGYLSLVDVLSEAGRRRQFLEQALAEYERANLKYEDLAELAGVRAEVGRVASKVKRKRSA